MAIRTLRCCQATSRLGAECDRDGVNFAVISAPAEGAGLCLSSPDGKDEMIARLFLPEFTDEVWHGYLPGLKSGASYGYRVRGPYDADKGHRFTPAGRSRCGKTSPSSGAKAGETVWLPAGLIRMEAEQTEEQWPTPAARRLG
jgi:1,4-alpha-glucan branching enzyme